MSIYQTIIQDTLEEAHGEGVADLCRLNQAVGYWAPEVKESWFWYGRGAISGYLDILNHNFQGNRAVRSLYTNFLETHYTGNLARV